MEDQEVELNSFQKLQLNMEEKYKDIFIKMRTVYNEDKDKVYDLVFRAVLTSPAPISNFRFCRVENSYSNKDYLVAQKNGVGESFETSVLGKTNSVYYFGFNYLLDKVEC